ncbi:glycoside hydrolase family 76 protein [Paenibacillus sp. NPDC056722]|uniref:glycoside hydrolase family 76 protein n=1 Tax=Paenibacillus sp. NPDC056722 TaxID=3345924 RepID=UPI00368C3844
MIYQQSNDKLIANIEQRTNNKLIGLTMGTLLLEDEVQLMSDLIQTVDMDSWKERAEWYQQQLLHNYYNAETGIMNQWYPQENSPADENFYYWWQAHVIDVLVDGLERTGSQGYADQIRELSRSLRAYNGGTFSHNYYDDMEWTALALLRAYKATGEQEYKLAVLELWKDIKTAWNDHFGGGMAWKKDQRDYKNTPANAPAAILAARLYGLFQDEEDLNWAERIYEWNKTHLVDPASGFVWDGINRQGDGEIDYDWEFTYCQGVFLGAALELYLNTGNTKYAADARRTSEACIERLCDADTRMLPDEGIDDTGLFKGILIRYWVQLYRQIPEQEQVREIILRNAGRLWESGLNKQLGLCSPSWEKAPELPVQLSVQLSGLMLLEAAAVVQEK